MGFEQLAELRAQLAAKAKQERNAKRPAAPADTGAKPKSGDQPQRGASRLRPAAKRRTARSRLRRSRRRRSIRSSLRSVNCSASFRVRSRRIRPPKCRSRSVSGTTSHVKHRPSKPAKPNCVKRCRRGAVATVTGRASSKTPCGSICRVTKQGVSRMTMRLEPPPEGSSSRQQGRGASGQGRAAAAEGRAAGRGRRRAATGKRGSASRRSAAGRAANGRKRVIRTAPLHTARRRPAGTSPAVNDPDRLTCLDRGRSDCPTGARRAGLTYPASNRPRDRTKKVRRSMLHARCFDLVVCV